MTQENRLKASLEWEGKKAVFEGLSEEVWASINRFLSETQPQIASIADFIIKVDVSKLLISLEGIIRIDKDVGPIVPVGVPLEKTSDREKVALYLLLRRVAFKTGHADKETAEVEEVVKDSKVRSAGVVLSNLVADYIVQNVGEAGKKGIYRITDYGIEWFVQSVLPNIKSASQ